MTPKRLPLLALPLMIINEIKTWYFLILLIAANGLRGRFGWLEILGIIGVIAVIVGFALIRYWRFTYALEGQAVTINSGLFVKKARHIPYANIQTLRRQQWFFLQPFGLESLSIETSGQESKSGEGTLFAVPLSVAEAIEARRHQHPATAPATPTPQVTEAKSSQTIYHINGRDLNIYALTSLGFLPILAVVGGAYNKLDDLIPHTWRDRAVDSLAHLAVLVIVGLVVAAIVLAIFVSYMNLLQRYYHFTLERDANTLTATRGLFKRNTVSVRLVRVQAIQLQQSILRQLFGLTTVQALTASNAADDESNNDLVLMPVVPTKQVYSAMHPFVGWLPTAAPTLTKVPKSSYFYYIRNIVLPHLIIVAILVGLVVAFGRNWLWLCVIGALLWLLLAALQGRYAARNAGVAIIDDHRLAIQTGNVWTRTQYIVRRENIQSLTAASSLWLDKHAKAHLRVNVRRGDGNKQLEVRYLDAATVTRVLAWYQPTDAHRQIF